MSLTFLLDTTIVSEPIAKRPNQKVLRRLDQYGIRCALAAPVWHELVYGCSRLATGARRAALEEYLQTVVQVSFPILPYDAPCAAWHGKERARLEGLGKVLPFVDGQIAAIANQNDLTVVTANPKHFTWFEDLTVVDWTR